MDESLSDFQEKKVTYTGPKKKKTSKSNTIKKDRKLKGQRDIRTLVKTRKNELLTYTKDFDQACRNSGLDVDPEQLQIAIALSKSLQESQPQHDEVSDNVKPLSAKERSRKIKSTLQEYGFKVPNTVAQKIKKRVTNKKSKLLNTSESEKRELISRKYAEILNKNHTLPTCNLVECDHSDKELYHKTTNIPYSKIRTVDEFYVPNFIEKTTHRTCLLRDWSEIPGRPLSPVVVVSKFKFDEFSFSQQELDCLLSRPLQEVQEIIKNKSVKICEEKVGTIEKTMDTSIKSDIKINNREMCDTKENECDVNYICTTQGDRSQSPDLFEEDDYLTTVHAKDQTQYLEIKSRDVSDKTSLMDLTECVGNMNNIQKTIMHSTKLLGFGNSKILEDLDSIEISEDPRHTETETVVSSCSFKDGISESITESKTVSQNETFQMGSQSKTSCSVTVREVNDFMEVTNCVVSEFNYNNINGSGKEEISKSSSLGDVEIHSPEIRSAEVNKNVLSPLDFKTNATNVNTEYFENIDLTQASDNTILCKTNNNLLASVIDDNQIEAPISMDLTQSSNSDEDFPIVKLSSSKEESSNATIILYDHNTSGNVLIPKYGKSLDNIALNEKHVTNESKNDSTENYSNIINEENYKVCNDPIVSKVNKKPVLNISEAKNDKSSMSNISDDSKINSEYNIDLTQSPELQSTSEDKIEFTQSPQSPNKTRSIECLGKQNNISIDYDELYDNNILSITPEMKDQEDFIDDDKDSIIELIDHDNDQSAIVNNDKILNNTEEYHILDKDYRFMEPPQRADVNFDEAITNSSVYVEDISIHSTNRNSNYLPSVELKKTNKIKDIGTETNHTELSPIKISHLNNKSFGTPVNDQYIIKTQNVTPMLDYESMSTSARQRELEKYGIKPFKRKRAIQLLTYIYNQTHPVVEDCAIDDMPSTTKKFKLDTQEETEQIPESKKHKISRQFEERDVDKENIYVETNVNPEIKKIECCPDDWVFQTREKAKIHSCRVPLHIAFHNYVSCRHMLRTAILRYEPVNIDIIHKDLIASGYRYNPKELLKFLDKKCITVKTTEKNGRNRKLNKS